MTGKKAKAGSLTDTDCTVAKLPAGAPVPPEEPSPHDEIDPSALRAANAFRLENSCVKPVPAGAPSPPKKPFPHGEIDPSAFRAAKAS